MPFSAGSLKRQAFVWLLVVVIAVMGLFVMSDEHPSHGPTATAVCTVERGVSYVSDQSG